ncbi:MAG TPA: UvrD-helicase domain-containing protein [Longimicrobiales bacterium]|nr:UvrD-helicase domain-containing protein [Longimicrobiales bacterium]
MSDPQILTFPLPDAEARLRIQSELDENLLVEAGAGSGKTTELVHRMVALVAGGKATVDRMAAVTFTRKAAGELRERFQARLEARIRELAALPGDDAELSRLRAALEDIDRAFIGTIHAFCARLLRERPLEVGLDPAFEELAAEERLALRRRFWESFLERLARDADPVLEELSEAGLRPVQLYGLFDTLVENPDVEYPIEQADPPSAAETAPVRRALEALVARGRELMPEREPAGSWDALQKRVRTAGFLMEVTGWKRPADFFEALEQLCTPSKKGHAITQKRWKNKEWAKAFKDDADRFGHGDTPARRLLDRWYAHRYALAIRLASEAARAFAEHRRRVGKLDFQDLLLLAARLLRTAPDARAELGRRYRYLLVDEFQDTDPLQAEIMMLLSSEPAAAGDGAPPVGVAAGGNGAGPDGERLEGGLAPVGGAEEADWRACTPRPGALFVVGDPKQSIYRFRRADIQLYEFVKRRFADFGHVLRLTANFRSRPGIGDLVNELFDRPGFFPSEPTAEQAAFEPLATRPATRPVPGEGVFWYALDPMRDAAESVAEDDADRIATWIRDRIDAGEREPGDFMILTRLTRSLSAYAKALEARAIPVQVTGAGVGVEMELLELLALLRCMVDPTDPVKVVAVLVGLFFGIDHERLVAHRTAGGGFDVIRPGASGHPDVVDALGVLHRWWRSASREPADVFLGRTVPELGVLPFAAAGELGTIRSGALVYALDAVRGAALAGDASLPGALDALGQALESKEAEAPLQPGRTDVVRLMNLHQAKGLEARVVVLADPSRQGPHPPSSHVERGPDGRAVGHLCVEERREGFRPRGILARPIGWEELEEAERRFDAAEQVRLLYVAVTRAREELLVARWPDKADASSWSALDPWLLEQGVELALDARTADPRDGLALRPEDLARRVDEAAARVAEASRPSFRHVSVTEVAKAAEPASEPGGAPPPPVAEAAGAPFRGYSWGSAVHGLLAASVADDSESSLRVVGRALLVEHGRPLDDHGEPKELDELVGLVRSVRASALWRRAAASGRVLAEVPFAVPGMTKPPPRPPPPSEPAAPSGGARGPRQLDLFGTGARPPEPEDLTPAGPDSIPDAIPSILEGVIDLAFREPDGWVVADYKTDVGADPDFASRLEAYRRQVDLYAAAWSRLTGEKVKERVLFFTSQGRVETW